MCVAVCCGVLRCAGLIISRDIIRAITCRMRVAVCCSVLQRVAVCETHHFPRQHRSYALYDTRKRDIIYERERNREICMYERVRNVYIRNMYIRNSRDVTKAMICRMCVTVCCSVLQCVAVCCSAHDSSFPAAA